MSRFLHLVFLVAALVVDSRSCFDRFSLVPFRPICFSYLIFYTVFLCLPPPSTALSSDVSSTLVPSLSLRSDLSFPPRFANGNSVSSFFLSFFSRRASQTRDCCRISYGTHQFSFPSAPSFPFHSSLDTSESPIEVSRAYLQTVTRIDPSVPMGKSFRFPCDTRGSSRFSFVIIAKIPVEPRGRSNCKHESVVSSSNDKPPWSRFLFQAILPSRNFAEPG